MEAAPSLRGVYDGHRAAALSGVPYSTLQYWARERVVVPSISPERVRLWSWSDLLKLRAVTWLRKRGHMGMQRVLALVGEIDQLGLADVPLKDLVLVSARGEPYIALDGVVFCADRGRQIGAGEFLYLVRPFDVTGPDLLIPRPTLRIIPGKVSGQPHVANTRIPSLSVYALSQSGYGVRDILTMLPDLTEGAVTESVDLEESLQPRAA
jgi:uncharacterized protein (DUF433 family)